MASFRGLTTPPGADKGLQVKSTDFPSSGGNGAELGECVFRVEKRDLISRALTGPSRSGTTASRKSAPFHPMPPE